MALTFSVLTPADKLLYLMVIAATLLGLFAIRDAWLHWRDLKLILNSNRTWTSTFRLCELVGKARYERLCAAHPAAAKAESEPRAVQARLVPNLLYLYFVLLALKALGHVEQRVRKPSTPAERANGWRLGHEWRAFVRAHPSSPWGKPH